MVTDENLRRQRTANSRLNEELVWTIREKLDEGLSSRELSEIYQVGMETIRRIGRRETWAWLPERSSIKKILAVPVSEEEQARITASQKRLLSMLDEGPKASDSVAFIEPPKPVESAIEKMQAAAKLVREKNQAGDIYLNELRGEKK